MPDYAHEWTDEQIDALERKIAKAYAQAAREMADKQKKAMKDYQRELSERLKALDDTEESQKAHKDWLRDQTIHNAWLGSMVNELSMKATETNQIAANMVNDSLPMIYAENANYAAYVVDESIGYDTGFSLMSEDTARVLFSGTGFVKERQEQKLNISINVPKDVRWNKQKFTSAITQGMLQGESVPDIVKRMKSIFGTNMSSAFRAVRTSITGAENLGRLNAFERAQELGIDLLQEWIATLDTRTRIAHRYMDGQKVPIGKPFYSELGEIMFPGDPNAEPENVYNCRCTLGGAIRGIPEDASDRWSRLPEGMTYEEWKNGYEAQNGTVNGKNILGTWTRRLGEFDFEIEDVLNAQGFDGLPKVVSAEEFEEAVKAANGGDGLIMQRTYSAPSQEILDEYRKQLYEGKWYVDCSTGGAQYGQGMYCAADYTGKLTQGIVGEMAHYKSIGELRLGANYASDDVKRDYIAKWVSENVEQKYQEAAKTYIEFEAHVSDASWKTVTEAVGILGEDKRQSLADSGIHSYAMTLTNGFSYTETMTLSQNAKIIDYSTLRKEWLKDDTEMNIGSWAAARGYDAINAENHGQSGSYTVVLNRTKLIIKEP